MSGFLPKSVWPKLGFIESKSHKVKCHIIHSKTWHPFFPSPLPPPKEVFIFLGQMLKFSLILNFLCECSERSCWKAQIGFPILSFTAVVESDTKATKKEWMLNWDWKLSVFNNKHYL